jgi:hypothetical protein
MNTGSSASQAHPYPGPTMGSSAGHPKVGFLAQLNTWPSNQWAEVIGVTTGEMGHQLRLVRYSADGHLRYTQRVLGSEIRTARDKFDVPPMDFIAGEVDVADGKLGAVRRRWPTRAKPAADINQAAPERFH